MNKLKRLSLLPEPEIADLYARPIFNHNEQLLYFEMNQTQKAIITEALYKNGSIAVKKIAQQLEISKTTLYLYLRHLKVAIGEKIQIF